MWYSGTRSLVALQEDLVLILIQVQLFSNRWMKFGACYWCVYQLLQSVPMWRHSDTIIPRADSSKRQVLWSLLFTFLKGRQQISELKLKEQHPEACLFFTSVWSVRNRHIMPTLPEQYVFFLRCYLPPGYLHPIYLKAQDDRLSFHVHGFLHDQVWCNCLCQFQILKVHGDITTVW